MGDEIFLFPESGSIVINMSLFDSFFLPLFTVELAPIRDIIEEGLFLNSLDSTFKFSPPLSLTTTSIVVVLSLFFY